MPLHVNGELLSSIPSFKTLDQKLPQKAATLCGKECQVVGPKGLLYVNQREYAVISPDDPHIRVMGSEDSTTCHLLVIRHSGSGVTAFAHMDGCDLTNGIKTMISSVKEMSLGKPDGRLNVYLAGGFLDDRENSVELSVSILQELINCREDLHLCVAAITDLNDTVRNGVHFPIIYGLAVNVATGDIYPAKLPDKGPDMNIRGACHFGGYDKLFNIYSNKDGLLRIGPYEWTIENDIVKWAQAPDRFIRRYLSTSPEQEPAYFEESVRNALVVLANHPKSQTLFPDGKPRFYRKEEDGSWKRL